VKIINEIPKEYNDDLPRLLKDFQQGVISLEEVAQILILWNDRGTFRPLHETDTRLDHYFISKQRRCEIEEEKKRIYQQK